MTDTPPPTPNVPAPDPGAGPVADPADVEKNKVMAVLAYLGILVLVPILAAKDSPFARYHSNQGLLLAITSIACGIVLMIVGLVAAFIPFAGLCIGCTADIVVVGGIITLVIMGILNAVNGRMRPLPVIGKLFTIIK
jgi:uncharacterized membrane protein